MYTYIHIAYYTFVSAYVTYSIFIDLPTANNIRSISTICVTYFDISWDAPSITCGDVYYEVSISPPPIEGDAVVTTVDRFLSVTGLNNSLPDVTITVTAINRAGRGDGRMLPVQLPRSLGKCCIYVHPIEWCINKCIYIYSTRNKDQIFFEDNIFYINCSRWKSFAVFAD